MVYYLSPSEQKYIDQANTEFWSDAGKNIDDWTIDFARNMQAADTMPFDPQWIPAVGSETARGISTAISGAVSLIPWWLWAGAALFVLHYAGEIKRDWSAR